MGRVILAMIGASLAGALGQVLMRRGMQQVGSLETWAPLELLAYFWRALCNPWVIAGTVASAVFYFAFLAVLSWAEVSVALPLTALEYIIVAVLGISLLRETIPPLRWAGILLVAAGVLLIGMAGGAGDSPRPESSSGKEVSHEQAVR
jgi:drug/metabolite transporter (DMT)-like permease